MAFKWWKCGWCLKWNWTKHVGACSRCQKEGTSVASI